MVAKYITQATTLENIIQTMSVEDEKVIISEITVESTYECVNKQLSDITLPTNTIIGCIIRKSSDMIVPTGNDTIHAGDKLLLLTSPENQRKAVAAITR